MRLRSLKYGPLFLLLIGQAFAQVESSEAIRFTDSLAVNRQVTGIHRVQEGTDGLNVSTYVSGKLNYAVATGTPNQLDITLPYSPVLTEGMVISIKATAANTAPVTLSVNGLPVYAVKKSSGADVDSAAIQPGQVMMVVFDGSKFQVVSKLHRPCKQGFVSVNGDFCIDAAPRDISNFYDAVQTCGDNGAMLCTWNQWYLACKDSALNGSGGYLSNFEWINDAGNNGSDAKVAGYNDASAYSGYGCKKSYSLPPTFTSLNAAVETSGSTVNIRFRCCYKK